MDARQRRRGSGVDTIELNTAELADNQAARTLPERCHQAGSTMPDSVMATRAWSVSVMTTLLNVAMANREPTPLLCSAHGACPTWDCSGPTQSS